MKTIYCLFITVCLISFSGLVSGQEYPNVLILDSVYSYNWTNNDWALNLKEYATLNGSGQTIQELFKKLNPSTSQFQDYTRILNSFTDTLTPTSITDQLWYSNAWNTYQYDHFLAKDILDTTYYKVWSILNNRFFVGYKYTYQYNDKLLPVVSMTQGLDTTTQGWFNMAKTTNTYTIFLQPLEQIVFSWENSTSTWDSVLKYENIYTNKSLTSTIEYEWNDSTANWINTFRTTYYYNASALLNLVVKEAWDTTLDVWDSVQQSLYIYNQNKWLMTISTSDYLQPKGTWINGSITYYTYFSSGKQKTMTGSIWDTVHLTYVTDAFQNVDSTTGKITESYTRSVDPRTFQINGGSRNVYTYGSTGDSLNWVSQLWNISGNNWANKFQVNYTFDSHDLLTEKVSQNWVTSDSSWLNTMKSDYFYTEFSGINEQLSKEKPCIYSNPMIIGYPIYCPDFKTGDIYTLRVCSETGVEVYQTNFIGGETVSISKSLTPGLYFLIIEENGSILYKDKVIILH
ncbi:MAG: hypothetical protein ABSD71_07260 [Bacteroidales bacterium]|jgi:hypothetical protein